MCPKLRKCTRYRMVALARDRAKVKKRWIPRTVRQAEVIGSRAIALRSKKVDTVRKAEVIGSVHDDVCTHRSRAAVQNRLAQKPGFYAESACTRQTRWIFRLLSATGLYVGSTTGHSETTHSATIHSVVNSQCDNSQPIRNEPFKPAP